MTEITTTTSNDPDQIMSTTTSLPPPYAWVTLADSELAVCIMAIEELLDRDGQNKIGEAMQGDPDWSRFYETFRNVADGLLERLRHLRQKLYGEKISTCKSDESNSGQEEK